MENSTKGITLETLPKGFTQLTNEVSEIKRQILAKCKDQPTDLPDQLTCSGSSPIFTPYSTSHLQHGKNEANGYTFPVLNVWYTLKRYEKSQKPKLNKKRCREKERNNRTTQF